MRALTAILGALLLGGLLAAPAAAQQLSASHRLVSKTVEYATYQAFKCDNSASIPGADSSTSGETCASDDYSLPMDGRGYTHLRVSYWEYGAGTGQVFVWHCHEAVGEEGIITEDPASAPSAVDPEPLCVELSAGAGVADFDGLTTGRITINFSSQALNWVVIEQANCTGDCDGTVMVTFAR